MRVLTTATIAILAGAAGIIWNASVFNYEVKQHGIRIDQLSSEVKQQGVRLDKVDQRFDKVDGRLDQLSSEVKQQGVRLDKVNQRLDKVERRLDERLIKSISSSGRSSSGWTRSCPRPSSCEVLVRGMDPGRRGTDSSLICGRGGLSCASCTFPP